MACGGYDILATAVTGEEAVRLIEETRPDIVLMDIHLGGGIDGIEAAARMRPELLIPVIYLTAYSETTMLERAADTRPYGYLVKPISERELHTTIQMALARSKVDASLKRAHSRLQESEAERRLAADALREKDRRLSDMMGNVDLIAIMIDRDARITYCNDYLLKLTGWRRDELMGKNGFDIFVPPEEEARSRAVFSDLLNNRPNAWHHEAKMLTKSGARLLIHWNNSLLHSASQEVIGTASIGEDITERQLAAEKISRLNQMNARALLAAKTANEAKRLFLASMSHELRTPLNAIIGFSEVLCSESFGPLGDPKYLEYSHDILGAGRHLLGLIQTILDVARFEGGDIPLGEAPESLAEAADWAIALLQRKIWDQRIVIGLEIDDRCPLIRIDPLHLRQLMINLIGNAVKFSKPGGKVGINAQLISGDVVLRISDNGVGIPPYAIDKVFNPFSQVDDGYAKKSDGVGLGLSICKSIAEAYGGSISLTSELGRRTTVSVVFPHTRVVIDSPATEGGHAAGLSPAAR